jgi:hypothetical protein
VRIEHPDLVRVRQQLLQPWDAKGSRNARPARHTSPTPGARRVPHNLFPGRFVFDRDPQHSSLSEKRGRSVRCDSMNRKNAFGSVTNSPNVILNSA